MLRNTLSLVAAIGLATVILPSSTSLADPPGDGIMFSCALGGESIVSGFKGNPSYVDFDWGTGSSTIVVRDYDVGGKFGSTIVMDTPATAVNFTYYVVYKQGTTYSALQTACT